MIPHRTVDLDATFGKQPFHVAAAEREAVVQPDGVSNDLGRETLASEGRDGYGADGLRADPTLLAALTCQCLCLCAWSED
jgi:hypothetical protein